MKKNLLFFSFFSIILLHSQVDDKNGDWSKRYVKLKNTPEAEMMIRHGDADNFGFGWKNVDPFTGQVTSPHPFPWKRDTNDSMGFDMIMVVSSYKPPHNLSHTGYCSESEDLTNQYGKTSFELKLNQDPDTNFRINKIMLQLFVDDMQAAKLGTKYRVYINKRRATFVEPSLNALDQTGPIGELISVNVPDSFLNEFKKDKLSFFIDDSTSGAGDGFALDFIKILYNPTNVSRGSAKIRVRDLNKVSYLENAVVTVVATGKQYPANPRGVVFVDSIPAGNAILQVSANGHPTAYVNLDVRKNQKADAVISLSESDASKSTIETGGQKNMLNQLLNSPFGNLSLPGVINNPLNGISLPNTNTNTTTTPRAGDSPVSNPGK